MSINTNYNSNFSLNQSELAKNLQSIDAESFQKSLNEVFQKEQVNTYKNTKSLTDNISKIDQTSLAKNNFDKIAQALDNIINPKTGEKVPFAFLNENNQKKIIDFAAENFYMFENDFKTLDMNIKIELNPDEISALVYFQNSRGETLDLMKNMGLDKIGDATKFSKQGISLTDKNNNNRELISNENGFMFIDPILIEHPELQAELVNGKLPKHLQHFLEEYDLKTKNNPREQNADKHYLGYMQIIDKLTNQFINTQTKTHIIDKTLLS